MTQPSPLEFSPPGPGSWEFDASHQSRPVPPLMQGPLARGATAGFRAAFAQVGALLDTIESRYVNGWNYMCPRPVGAPPDATGTPPKWIFKALLVLHPELRRRNRLAARTFEDRVWQEAERRWVQEDGPRHRASLSSLQARAPGGRSTTELREDLREALSLMEEVMVDHFRHCIPGALPLGDLLVKGQALGLEAAQIVKVVSGASVETARPVRLLLTVAAAVRAQDPGLIDVDDDSLALERLESLPAAASAWRAFLDEYGHRPIGGEIEGPSLVELPGPTLAGLRRLIREEFVLPDPEVGRLAARRLAERLPEDRREWWLDAAEQARYAVTYREDSASLVGWSGGLARRVALELGRREVSEGRALDPAHILQLTVEELDSPPSPQELRVRAETMALSAAATPPQALGPGGSPPPLEWLPAAAARMTSAVMAYTTRFHAAPDLGVVPEGELRGLPVSPGVVRGRAVVIEDIAEVARIPEGSILVARTTTSALNPVLPAVIGLVTELGGLICHAAIVSRELGFPGVVGCAGATSEIPDGALIEVNGHTGEVRVLAAEAAEPAGRPARNPTREPPTEATLPEVPGRLVPLIEASEREHFGGKAASLARALGLELPVPDGLALDTAFVQAVAAGDPDHLERLAQALTRLPGPLAVRSSAPAEDGNSASFAGLHHTELGARGHEEVVSAISTCWRSAHAPAALAYRARLGITSTPGMAVVLQPLVAAATAGVRFGRDPVTGEDTRIIEAAPGLGEVVVDGRVRPDRVHLDPNGKELSRSEGHKPVRMVLREGAVREEAVEHAAFSLHPHLVAQVHALGETCDRHFGSPQDVEWATDGDTLWLLQSRPITTALRSARSPEAAAGPRP